MNVNFNGYNENVITFIADKSLTKAGVPVKISGNGTVAPCTASDSKLCGVCVNVRDGYATVQLSGYVRVPFTGNAAVGFQSIKPADGGKVTIGAGGRECLVTDFDSQYIGFIL